MFETNYSMKSMFFDRAAVKNSLSKAEHKNLSKIGAYVRKRARSLLRKRKKASSPGSPPSVHTADKVASLRNILFAYLPREHSVIIGPVGLNQVNYMAAGYKTTIPALMEFGGLLNIREWRFDLLDKRTAEMVAKYPSMMKFAETWTRRDMRWFMTSRHRKWTLNDLGIEQRVRAASYPARPFMGPALQAEIDAGTIAGVWAGTVKAA